MDRLIWTAWRAFWVGLGASAVLIAQSVVTPPGRPAAGPPTTAGVDDGDGAVSCPASTSDDPLPARRPLRAGARGES